MPISNFQVETDFIHRRVVKGKKSCIKKPNRAVSLRGVSFDSKIRGRLLCQKLLVMNDDEEEENDDYDDDDENNLVNSIQTVSIRMSAGVARTTLILLVEHENIPFNKTSHRKRGTVGNA